MSGDVFLWVKVFHVFAAIAWMAGLFYLPRLFVYHASSTPGSEQSETFKLMELRLARAIMLPAVVVTWIFGLVLVFYPDSSVYPIEGWFALKGAAVVALTLYHVFLERTLGLFVAGRNVRSPRYWKIVNEVPTLLLLVVLVAVIVRPF